MDIGALMSALERVTWLTPLIAALWGLASVGLSACHLSSVPLLVTFLGRMEGQRLSPARLSALVTVGLSGSLILVAALTYALGRILGDLWGLGPWLMVGLLLLGGLHLMGALSIPSIGGLDAAKVRPGARSALASGGVLGVTLGPCTFSFFAPVLALVGSGHPPLLVGLSIASFTLTHLGLNWALGFAGATLGARLARGARWAHVIKFMVGALAIGIALWLIVTVP